MTTITRKLASLALATVIAASAFALPALAATDLDTAPRTIALVEAPRPALAPRGLIVRKMRQSVDTYAAIPGLVEKEYILSEDRTIGGFYRWRDRASADAFYGPDWQARILRQYKTPARIAWFDSPLAVDGPAVDSPRPETAVAALVLVPVPPSVSREQIEAGFVASAPTYQHAPGLRRKWFVITSDGRIGGVYLWTDRAAAQAFYSDAWRDRVRRTYGQDAAIRYFEAPLTMRR